MSKKAPLTGLLHEELEPRLLFSAGAEAVLLDTGLPDDEAAIVETITEAEVEVLQLEIIQQDTDSTVPAKEVVFIDENVPDYDELMADLAGKDNIDIYILDSSLDGVEQISAVLENYQNLDAIHLVSHGDEEGLYLGNASLTNDSLNSYRGTISGWQSALNEQADLLIYGCDVASSEEGLNLLNELNTLTGTDIAASDDLTGHGSLGGDWELEHTQGNIETGIVFSEQMQNDWVGILPPNVAPVNTVPGAQVTDQDVAIIFKTDNSNLISVSDADAGGAAIQVSLSVNNGTITLDGTTGLSFTTGDGVSDASMTFTGSISDINSALSSMSYNPTTSWSGTDTLTISTDDLGNTGGGGNGTDVDTVTITVNSTNNAPVLDNTGSPAFTTITENDLATAGDTVASLLGTSVTDADSGASEGIAVTGLNSSNGTWQYRVDAGAWTDVGTVNSGSALLLKDTDSLRFVPDGANADTATITYSAWDQTTGAAGSKVDASSTGGTTAFSTASETASITVTAVNDNPVVNNLAGDTLAYTEGSGPQIIEQAGDVSVLDVDSSDFNTGTLTVSITTGNDPAEDVLSINNQGTGAGQIGVSGSDVTYEGVIIGTFAGGSSGADLVFTFNANATPTAVEALLRNVTYENTDTGTATLGARTVRFDLTDGDGGNSFSMDTTVNVNAGPNNAPTAANTTVTTNEDTNHVFSVADFSYSDIDGDTLASIKITSLEAAGSLQLSGVDVTLNQVISKADIDAGNLTFTPVPGASGVAHDSFDFSVNDATTDSIASYTMTIDVNPVNDAPIISGTPAGNITAGNTYSFIPTANDADGDSLVYSVSNLPEWASFNTSTGEISGTPGDNHAGTYANIMISVSDGTVTSTLAAFDITVDSDVTAPASISVTSPPDIPVPDIQEDLITGPEITVEEEEESSTTSLFSEETNIDNVDVELDVDENGKATILLKHGNQELLHALTVKQIDSTNVDVLGSQDRVNEENTLIESVSPWQLDSDVLSIDLKKALDELNEQLGSDGSAEQSNNQVIVTTAAGLTIGLTAGFVTWALQGSSLLTALLTTLPAWNTFDPLPVLNAKRDKKEASIDTEESDGIDSVFADFQSNTDK